MIRRVALFSLLLAFPGVSAALLGAERIVRQSLPVQPGWELRVDAYRGSITVEEGNGSEIRLELLEVSSLSDPDAAGKALDSLRVDMKAEGNGISLHVWNAGEKRVRFSWDEAEPLGISCKLTVPRQCNVDLTTSTGDIVVGPLAGRMKARTETGTIFFRGVSGSVRATSGMGDIVVSHCTGDVFAEARRGTIRVGTIGGRAELRATNGEIEIRNARGALDASSNAGDISVGFARGRTEGAKVEAGGGSIFATIDPAVDCVVNASSTWGRVETTLPLAIESGGRGTKKLSGRLNRGGPVLTLRASGGHVKIEPGVDLAE